MSLDEVFDEIAAFEPRSGWIQTTSSVSPWSKSLLTSSQLLLCAELEAPQQSLHIRQTHKGWLLTWAEEEKDHSGDKLLYRVTHLAREGFGSLHYDVFWDTKAQPHSPIFARLCATHPVEEDR